jgi:hypothetical protein
MDTYVITYATSTTPITLEVQAEDPYTACMILGRKTTVKELKVLKIVVVHKPETIWMG